MAGATRIPEDHPALAGRELVPLEPQPPWFDSRTEARGASPDSKWKPANPAQRREVVACEGPAGREDPMRAVRLLRLVFLVALPLASQPAWADLRSEFFVSSEILGIPTTNPFQQAPIGPLQDAFDVDPPPVPVLPWGEVHVSTFVDYGFFQLGAFLEIHADDFAFPGGPPSTAERGPRE